MSDLENRQNPVNAGFRNANGSRISGGPGKSEDEMDADWASSRSSLDGDELTEEEKQTLRKVSDKLPWSTFLVAVVELCERFAYYGLSGPFQNYMSNSWYCSATASWYS